MIDLLLLRFSPVISQRIENVSNSMYFMVLYSSVTHLFLRYLLNTILAISFGFRSTGSSVYSLLFYRPQCGHQDLSWLHHRGHGRFHGAAHRRGEGAFPGPEKPAGCGTSLQRNHESLQTNIPAGGS